MRRLASLLSVCILLFFFTGCGRDNPPAKERVEVKLDDGVNPADKGKDADKEKKEDKKLDPGPKEDAPLDRVKQDKYEAAFAEGLTHLGDGDLSKALIAFETARTFNDTDLIREEIVKLKSRLEADRSTTKTIDDIRTILDAGKEEEAAKLLTAASRDLAGDKVRADELATLRLEAEALRAAKEDAATRFTRLKAEGDAALKEDNLRAALLAFDSALFVREDAALKNEADGLRTRVEKYDGLRSRAAELRKDSSQLEESLALLEEAQTTWKTLQVLQDIDECRLALSRRRETISVADFEVRGETGIADAGKSLAEELLPHFKPRFDLVERAQVHKVVRELKLEETFLDDPEHHRTVGKLAKVRYLVLGSIRRDSGVTVNARLVDARSGLIVQTAKVVAPTPEELWPALPELAKQLLMSDEEKAAYDAERIRKAERPIAVVEAAPLPPPPALVEVPEERPDPILVHTPVPPDFGGLELKHFEGLPPPPPPGKTVFIAPGGAGEDRVKRGFLHATLALGDNLFRRGDYREAQRHFEFALSLAPGEFDIQLRIDRCRPHLPPPVVIVEPVVILPPKPRVAILNFITIGDPRVTPPYLSHWTPAHLAPYFRFDYDVVDPGVVYWYMAKTGLTLRDLMHDPYARRWLGRALGVRFFVLGTIHETASFDVNTYLLDAEFGYLSGRGTLHARNPFELKLRLHELARMTLMRPGEREAWLADRERFEGLLFKGRHSHDRGEFHLAIDFFEGALKIRPRHLETLDYLERSRRAHRHALLEAERHRQFLIQKALEEEARRRHLEVVRISEGVRVGIVIGSPPPPIFVERRETAAVHLVKEAHVALKVGNFSLSISKFESALRLSPARNDWVRDLALARAESERHARTAAVAEAARRDAEAQRLREEELRKTRLALETERLRAAAALAAERKAREERDEIAYQAAFSEGERLLKAKDYDGAISALQLARRYKDSKFVNALLTTASVRQAEAAALAKGEMEREELEKKLAAERVRRKAAEAEAKRNQELYQDALELAHKALAAREYEIAQARFEEAGKVFRTDAVLTGLKRTQAERDRLREEKEAVAKKAKEASEREGRLKTLLTEGNAFFEAKAYKKAIDSFLQAKGLAPDNIDVLTGLTKAQQAQDRALSEARRKTEEAGRLKDFERLVQTGQDNLNAKQFEAAVIAFGQALKLKPGDKATKALLDNAEKSRSALLADAAAKAAAEKNAAAYQKLFADGKSALEAKRFDDAIKSFTAAQKLLPGDKSSSAFLEEARTAKKKADDDVALAAKMRVEEIQRAADLKKALDQARTALAARDLSAAQKALALASKLDAKSPDLLRVQNEFQQAEKAAALAAAAEKKRRSDYVALLDAARKQWKAGQFDDALKTITQANSLIPEAKEGAALLREVQKARDDAFKAGEETARLAQLQKLLDGAGAAMKSGDLDAAEKLLRQADKLAAKDAGVAKAFQALGKARAAADEKLKDAADLAKRKTAYLSALSAAEKAAKAKQYDQAVSALNDALKLFPGDAKASDLLTATQKAWSDVKGETADAAKAKAAYDAAISLGDKALKSKQYDQAVKAYGDALKLIPGDAAAGRALKEAQTAWDAAKLDAADAAKRALAFGQAVADGEKALKAGQYEAAVRAFGDAVKINPADAKASQYLKDARKAWDDSKAAATAEAKLKAAFNDAMLDGQKAFTGKKFAEAVNAFTRAVKLVPGDKTAAASLGQAQAALDAEHRLEDDAKKKKTDEARLALEVARLLKEADALMKSKRFDDAQKSFAAVLKLQPGQPDAQRGLADAARALEASKMPPPGKDGPGKDAPGKDAPGKDKKDVKDKKEVKDKPAKDDPKAGVDKLLASGLEFEKKLNWPEAFKAYQEALKLDPKDARLGPALKRVEFNHRLTEGQKHLDAKRFAEATKELEAALALFPGNPSATKLLERAKKKK